MKFNFWSVEYIALIIFVALVLALSPYLPENMTTIGLVVGVLGYVETKFAKAWLILNLFLASWGRTGIAIKKDNK